MFLSSAKDKKYHLRTILAGTYLMSPLVLALEPAVAAEPSLPDCGGKYGRIISTPNVSTPSVGTEREVEVGGTLLSVSESSVMEVGLSLRKPTSVFGRRAGADFVIDVPAGQLSTQNARTTGMFAVPEASFRYARDGKERRGLSRPDIFVSSDLANPSALILHISFGLSSQQLPMQGAEFEQVRCLAISPKHFRREILYSGAAKGVITFQYREFQNNLARPAFSQELTYDLSDGNEIGFKGARIRVVKVSNVGLRYVVVKSLE